MKKITKQIIFLILISILIKGILSFLIQAPTNFADEFLYAKIAGSIFLEQNFEIFGKNFLDFPPLYSIILSISYLFKNMEIVFFIIKIINIILTSLCIIPIYLILKEIIPKEKLFLCLIIANLMPITFSMYPFILAENLYILLYLFAFYFIYKLNKTNETKYALFAGIIAGLTILTKINGVSLLVLIPLLIIRKRIKQIIIYICSLLLTISPWFIYKTINNTTILGSYTPFLTITPNYIIELITWIILNFYYVILALLIIPFFYFILNFKEQIKQNKELVITTITIAIGIIIVCSHTNILTNPNFPTLIPWIKTRIIGRYLAPLTIILFILCLWGITIQNTKQINKKIIALFIAFSLLGTQIVFSNLLPVNNLELTLFGISQIVFNYITESKIIISLIYFLLFAGLSIISYYLILKNNKKQIIALIITIFIIINIVNIGISSYKARTYWYDKEQMQLGLWMNKNIEKEAIIIFDKEDGNGYFKKEKQEGIYQITKAQYPNSIIGFWITNKITIDDATSKKGDYLLTTKDLKLKKIKETNSGIKLYQIN